MSKEQDALLVILKLVIDLIEASLASGSPGSLNETAVPLETTLEQLAMQIAKAYHAHTGRCMQTDLFLPPEPHS